MDDHMGVNNFPLVEVPRRLETAFSSSQVKSEPTILHSPCVELELARSYSRAALKRLSSVPEAAALPEVGGILRHRRSECSRPWGSSPFLALLEWRCPSLWGVALARCSSCGVASV